MDVGVADKSRPKSKSKPKSRAKKKALVPADAPAPAAADRGSFGRIVCVTLAALGAIVFAVVFTHQPIVLVGGNHDDGLFIRLGFELATSGWLGDFNQYTLMKGPGYPLFLALSSWLGTPITLAQVLFHIFAAAILAWVAAKLIRSKLLGLLIFVFVLWHPVFLPDRILRDAIYSGQSMLVLACLAYCLFGAENWRGRVLWGLAAGLAFGWFWLTREEGVWLVPGIGLLVLVALIRYWRSRQLLAGALPALAGFVIMSALVLAGFRTGNYLAYGSFVGVDTKQRDFTAAIGALQSVRVGRREPHVPVPRKVRAQIYRVSPAFASLRGFFDGPNGTPWQSGCSVYPSTCGDIAGGWFMWALREAVFIQGHYKSPASASAFYGRLAREIKLACRIGKLKCEPSPIPFISPPGARELRLVPDKVWQSVRRLSFAQRTPPKRHSSKGSPTFIARALAFLNHPRHRLAADRQSELILTGWYYRRGDDWFAPLVEDDKTGRQRAGIERKDSPRLIQQFNDPKAGRQRFEIRARCRNNCRLVLTGPGGVIFKLAHNALVSGALHHLGGGLMFIRTAVKPGADTTRLDLRQRVSRIGRFLAIALYTNTLPVLFAIGAFAFVLAVFLALRRRTGNLALLLAAAAWVAIAARLAILVLIDLTMFPGLGDGYMRPAHYLLIFAILTSLAALVPYIVATFRKPVPEPET
jgi:hypothetical protein